MEHIASLAVTYGVMILGIAAAFWCVNNLHDWNAEEENDDAR